MLFLKKQKKELGMSEHHSLRGRNMMGAFTTDIDSFVRPALQDVKREQRQEDGTNEYSVEGGYIAPRAQTAAIFPDGGGSLPSRLKPLGRNMSIAGRPVRMFGQQAGTITMVPSMHMRKKRIIQPPTSSLHSIQIEITLRPDYYWSDKILGVHYEGLYGKRKLQEILGGKKMLFYYTVQSGHDGACNYLINLAHLNKILEVNADMPLPALAGVLSYSSELGYDAADYQATETFGSYTASFYAKGPVADVINYWVMCKPYPRVMNHLWFCKEYRKNAKVKRGVSASMVPVVTESKIAPSNECVYVGYVRENSSNFFNESRRNEAALASHMSSFDCNDPIATLDSVVIGLE